MKNMKKKSVDSRPTEKRSINSPNEINTSVEIPMYAPNMGLMPKEYQISPQLNDLEKRFKELCESFLSKSKPDEFNSSYMDAVIERICIDAIRFVKVQRCDHEQLIMKALDAMSCFMTGCSGTDSDATALAVVGSPHSNEPSFPLNAATIRDRLYNCCYTYGSVSFITNDGNPKVVYQTDIPKPEKSGLSENKKKTIAGNYTSQLLKELWEILLR